MKTQLIEDTEKTFSQVFMALKNIPTDAYSKELSVLNQFSLGSHFRHIVEFYSMFLSKKTPVAYEKRSRDMKLEKDKEYCLQTFQKTLQQIQKIEDFSQTIEIEENGLTHKSSLSRELLFCNEHAIHHLSIIKIAISACLPEIVLDKNFGVAFSTMRNKDVCAPSSS